MTSPLEQGGAGNLRESSRHISPVVAHELNNVLTIVQGYADCLLVKRQADATLQPHLKLISEATKRATAIVREAAP
jgi:signal transduction histidine kinase